MATDAVGKHPDPWIAPCVTIAETEHNEGKPSEEKQAIQQRTASNASRDAEQRTLGSQGCKQNDDKDDGINSSIAIETRFAECLGKRKQTAFLNDALHYGTTQGKHHKPTMQTVVGMPEKPAQTLIIEDTATGYTQSRQYPRKEGQQSGKHQTEDENSLTIVHLLQGCLGR